MNKCICKVWKLKKFEGLVYMNFMSCTLLTLCELMICWTIVIHHISTDDVFCSRCKADRHCALKELTRRGTRRLYQSTSSKFAPWLVMPTNAMESGRWSIVDRRKMVVRRKCSSSQGNSLQTLIYNNFIAVTVDGLPVWMCLCVCLHACLPLFVSMPVSHSLSPCLSPTLSVNVLSALINNWLLQEIFSVAKSRQWNHLPIGVQ